MQLKFVKLDQKRQDSIINAALKEFAKNGFDDASTNKIAKEAGISKGLLFHYVNNKKDLFLFLLHEYTPRLIKEELFGLINYNERDLLERFRQIALIKVELIHKYPQLFDFIKTVMYSEADKVMVDLEKIIKDNSLIKFQNLFEGVDKSKFRDDIDAEKVKNLIIWALNGYSDKLQEEFKDLEWNKVDYNGVLAEFDSYLEVIRKCFYKETMVS